MDLIKHGTSYIWLFKNMGMTCMTYDIYKRQVLYI